MEIQDSIIRTKKEETILKSLFWNSIILVFKEEKNINIVSYLISVKVNWWKIILKTKDPLINTELILINEKIKTIFLDKLKKVWIKYDNFVIKYVL